jgi:hypothetical protein
VPVYRPQVVLSLADRLKGVDRELSSGCAQCFYPTLYIVVLGFLINIFFSFMETFTYYSSYYYSYNTSSSSSSSDEYNMIKNVVRQYVLAFLIIVNGVSLMIYFFYQVYAIHEKKAAYATSAVIHTFVYGVLTFFTMVYMGNCNGAIANMTPTWVFHFLVHIFFITPMAFYIRSMVIDRQDLAEKVDRKELMDKFEKLEKLQTKEAEEDKGETKLLIKNDLPL